MGLGEQIAAARRAKGWSQTRLAEELDVSTEAVGKWERNQYAPNREKLSRLTECLDVFAFDDKGDRKDLRFFDEEHMSAFLKGQFGAKGLTEAAAALTYAKARHAGQPRKPIAAGIPYIYHPLSLACHAMAMGLEEDTLLAALLLHDVSEDCAVAPEDLPFSPEAREIVGLVTKPADRSQFSENDYYAAILQNPRACLVKCIDRCHNLSSMSAGFSDAKIARYVKETETYYPELLKAVKAVPAYNSAAWLLRYQIKALLDMAARICWISSST